MSFKIATPEETKAWLGAGQIHFGGASKPGSTASLPDAPVREGFRSQQEFEEATGRWQETVGRIKAMRERALKVSHGK